MKSLQRSQRYNVVLLDVFYFQLQFLLLMSLLRYVLYFLTRAQFDWVETVVAGQAFFVGLRFDLLVLGFLCLPLVTLFPLLFFLNIQEKNLALILKIYLLLNWSLIVGSSLLSLPHYVLTGQHFRWREQKDFFVWPAWDAVTSILIISIFFLLLLGGYKTILKRAFFQSSQWPKLAVWSRRGEIVFRFLVPFLLVALAARGSLAPHHLGKQDSEISVWRHVNELALNPIWCFNK